MLRLEMVFGSILEKLRGGGEEMIDINFLHQPMFSILEDLKIQEILCLLRMRIWLQEFF